MRRPSLLTLTVLVVDDDACVRHFIARELEEVGFCVLTAANGNEALRMLEQSEMEVHLMVCDLLIRARRLSTCRQARVVT